MKNLLEIMRDYCNEHDCDYGKCRFFDIDLESNCELKSFDSLADFEIEDFTNDLVEWDSENN